MENIFQYNQESSASTFMEALEGIHEQGTGVLSSIENANTNILVDFDRRLQATNARRVRAWRVMAAEQAAKIVVSDFTDIDQANTVVTVRADSASVSLKERSAPAEAVIQGTAFSVNSGDVQALNETQSIVRVTTSDGAAPTGQFDVTLVTALSISQLIIDVVATPGSPAITVATSSDGITYTTATQVTINGYRINSWLPSLKVKYIQMTVTPSHPDNLNGSSFTFGITNLTANAVTYQLRSDFMTKVLQFNPKSEKVVLNAKSDPDILYYISIYPTGNLPTSFVELNPGDAVQIGIAVSLQTVISGSMSNILATAPLDLYQSSVVVSEVGATKPLRLALGLSPSDPNIANLQDEYVVLVATSIGYDIQLLNATRIYNPPRTFNISYVYGPSSVSFQLKVRLTTDDETITPIFTGASLDEL